MKYVGLNLKNYLKKEPVIFALMIVCVVASVVIMFFSFGLYHHIEQKKMDAKLGQTDLSINLQGNKERGVTKEEFVEACKKLPKDILDNCYFSAAAKLPGAEELEDDTVATVMLHFSVRDGKVTCADIGEKLKKQDYIVEGEWFNARQVENGELVCLAFEPNVTIVYPDDKSEAYAKQFQPNRDGKYVVDGKEYTCIGYQDSVVVPLIPITTMEEDTIISRTGIFFDKVINRERYYAIREVFEECLGDAVEMPPLAIPELDGTQFYTTLTIICILMTILSGVVLAMLYEYILLQRKRELTIFRLCGLSISKAKGMYLTECALITGMAMLVAVIVVRIFILPWAQNVYEYIGKSYTWGSCAVLLGMYGVITFFVLLGMLRLKIKQNVFDTYCE